MRNQALWLGLLAIGAALAGLALLRVLTRPLAMVEAHARAVAEERFPPPAPVPSTPELANVVVAINELVQRLQISFRTQSQLTEQLRDEARRDLVTGLPNRRGFDARVDTLIGDSDGLANSAMLLLTVTHLDLFNMQAGRHAGDALLRALAGQLRDAVRSWPDAVIGRRSGTDLGVLLPGIGVERARAALHRATAAVATLPAVRERRHGVDVAIGMSFTSEPRTRRQMLADADAALREAEAQGPGGHPVFHVGDGGPRSVGAVIRRAGQWQDLVARAITHGELAIRLQPWVRCPDRKLLQHELLAHPANPDVPVPETAFQPLAERLGLGEDLDRWVLGQVFEHAPAARVPVAVNICPASLQADGFCDWLVAECRNSGMQDRLLLELPEWALTQQPERVEVLFRLLRHQGIGVSLDHFGTGGLPLSWLQRLGLAQVKVDRSFVARLDRRQEHQFFLRSLCQIASSIHADVLVDGVDGDAQFSLLGRLGVAGAAGQVLGMASARG